MRRWLTMLGVAIEAGILVVLGPTLARATPDDARARAALAGLRLPIVTNQGQVDAQVAFYAQTFAGTLFVTRQGELIYALPPAGADARRGMRGASPNPGWTLTESLRGGRARPVGQDASATGVSYFLGNDPARWRSRVPAYDQLALGEVWPGVTVSLHARGRSIEKIFTVKPGASVSRIRVRVGGATALAVDADGALVARTGLGPVTFTAPVAYQEHDGVRRPVAVTYRLTGHEYGFTVASYDPSLPLVIDPILRSTYLGGSNFDGAGALAIHPTTGDVYVAGGTLSTNFPGTAGGPQPAKSGGSGTFDAFVARLPRTLTSLTQATYLGGSDIDYADALAIHPTTGDVYVAGSTFSTNLPGTAGSAQPTFGGDMDGFVARLPSSLTSLTRATYLGGNTIDAAGALAIHPMTGDVYVAGNTQSTNFPKTAGAAQTTAGGNGDAFVARLTSSLTSLTQATYLGGSNLESASALAIHPTTGDVYVTGNTESTNFPAVGGSAQPTFGGGGRDGFVARLTSSLSSLTQATYLGGGSDDRASGLAIHPMTGDVYVVGTTTSTNFPATTGGAQPKYGGDGLDDGFVARLTGTLTSLTQATYLGGRDDDNANDVAINPNSGEVYVTGRTTSTGLQRDGAAQPTPAGQEDAFVARLASSLTVIVQATYLGGSSNDFGAALAIHPTTGDVYVAGGTSSASFPATAGSAQPTYGGGTDAFVARLTFSLAAVDGLGLSVLVNQPTFVVGQTLKVSVGIINPGLAGTADFYLGAIRPDGLLEFFTSTGIGVGPLESLQPVATGLPLATPFAAPVPNFFTHQWTASDPRGRYVFFFAALSGGQLVGLGTTPYTFP